MMWAGLQQPGKILGRHGFAEQIALALLAVPGLEELQLFDGLHALGNDIEVQALAQADNGTDQLHVLGVLAQATNKRLVDFY